MEVTISRTTNVITKIDCNKDVHTACQQTCQERCQVGQDFTSCFETLPEGCQYEFEGQFIQDVSVCQTHRAHEPVGFNQVDMESDRSTLYTSISTPIHLPQPLSFDPTMIQSFHWLYMVNETTLTALQNMPCVSPLVTVEFTETCGYTGTQGGVTRFTDVVFDFESLALSINVTDAAYDAMAKPEAAGILKNKQAAFMTVYETRPYDSQLGCIAGDGTETDTTKDLSTSVRYVMDWKLDMSVIFRDAESRFGLPAPEADLLCQGAISCSECVTRIGGVTWNGTCV
eukprot:Blabericola_migrator_1__11563@NODE_691_length_6858_cov_73_696657_g460_i1_p2_GENE_NODE_691_length_6858_cov_73_696657_g460_i1NODE_691_length_6858_cov_73_696657_g460_i1_p2_ORF_typecomplete_len285_score41_65_NODE_691_length_6858_cov_73_696657_g460_i156556509